MKSYNSLVIFFLGKEIICSCVWQWGLRWKYIMILWPFVFIGFQSGGLEKKLEVLYEKNLSLFEHLFLSAWIIMSSLFLMSWILWKSILCILRALFIVLGCLLACLLDYKGLLQVRNVGCGFLLWKKMIYKAQRVF